MKKIIDLGKIGITLAGEYNDKTIYEKLTIVLYKGKSYISTKTVQGISPTQDIRSWQLVAEAKDAYHMLVDAGKTTLTEKEFLEQLVDATKGRYIVQGNIINAADEEDLTIEHSDLLGIDTLKLANRDNTNGMGYIILRKNKSFTEQVTKENTIYEIRYDFELNGANITIPENCVLKFNGGKLKNGSILGSNTSIQAEESVLFTNIHIAGDWAVPIIKSSMFSDITENNKIKELFNLSSNILKNTIIIEEGNYQVSATPSNETVIDIKNNTDVILNGTITLIPNNLINAKIIRCFIVKNISISGSGSIVGDKMSHTGTTGEWGHGISITGGCQNITIKGIKIKDCWGDGITIDDAEKYKEPNKNITIENFTIDNCRRQGISVISAEKCVIKNGFINNISGTAPYLGIDIEPNKDGYCKDISIIGVTIDSLLGIGCHTYSGVQNFNISIEKCRIFTHGEATNGDYAGITAVGVKGLFIKDNIIEDDILVGLSLRATNNNVIISNNVINCKKYILIECTGNILSNNTISNELGISISSSVLSKNNFISTNSFIHGNFKRNIVTGNTIDCNELKDEPDTNDNVFSGNIINATTRVLCNKSSRFTDNKIITSQLSVYCPYFAHNDCHVNTFNIYSLISGCILYATNGAIRGSICEGTTFWQTGNPTSGEAFIDVYADMKDCIIHQDASFTATNIVLYIKKAGVLLDNIKVVEKRQEIYDIYSGNINYILKDCVVAKYTQPLSFSDIRIANQGSERPTLNLYQKGFNFFDTTLNKPIYWTGTKWVDENNISIDALKFGTFEQKPTVDTHNIPIGYKYFCTNKQSIEGGNDGIEIIHKGNNIWCDALGREIS